MTCKDCIHYDACMDMFFGKDDDFDGCRFYDDCLKMGLFKSKSDYAEAKHGEWIYHECVSSYEGAISGYSCSECSAFVNEEMFDSDEFHGSYCGCCGAKMDGKEYRR